MHRGLIFEQVTREVLREAAKGPNGIIFAAVLDEIDKRVHARIEEEGDE